MRKKSTQETRRQVFLPGVGEEMHHEGLCVVQRHDRDQEAANEVVGLAWVEAVSQPRLEGGQPRFHCLGEGMKESENEVGRNRTKKIGVLELG